MAGTVSKKKENRTQWNPMDFVILLLVVLCLFGAVIRVGQGKWFADRSELGEFDVHFSITDIAYTSKDALVIGDTVTLCEPQAILGTLKSIDSITPATLYVKDENGNVLSVNYPQSTRIDVKGTLQSMGKMTENGYLLDGTIYLAPGKTYRVQSEHMDFVLNILDIEEN